jgi:hypothetical protein
MDSRRRVIFNDFGSERRHRCDSERPSVSSYRIESHQTNYLIQRAVLKYNYDGFSTPCYLPCFWMRKTSSLPVRKTRCTIDDEGCRSELAVVSVHHQLYSNELFIQLFSSLSMFYCHSCQQRRVDRMEMHRKGLLT